MIKKKQVSTTDNGFEVHEHMWSNQMFTAYIDEVAGEGCWRKKMQPRMEEIVKWSLLCAQVRIMGIPPQPVVKRGDPLAPSNAAVPFGRITCPKKKEGGHARHKLRVCCRRVIIEFEAGCGARAGTCRGRVFPIPPIG